MTLKQFDPARARETARRIREGKPAAPLVVTEPHNPEAVSISTWQPRAA